MEVTLRRKIVILTAIAAMFITGGLAWGESKSTGLPFDDITGLYGQQDIINLYKKGIVTGSGNRLYEPERSVSRAEFITMVNRMFNLQPVASDIPAYDDVTRGAWYYGAVQAGSLLHLVEGTGERSFQPQQAVTRQEAAAIIVRAFKQSAKTDSGVLSYPDASQIAKWAKPYVSVMQKLKLMNGDEEGFRPNDSLTRQETAVVLNRALQRPDWSKALTKAPPKRIEMGWKHELTTQQYISKVSGSTVNTLSPRWYFLDAKESVTDQTDKTLLTWAKNNGKQVWALVGNRFNADLTHEVLTNPTKKTSVITKLIGFVKTYKLNGLNLDFENVRPEDRQALTAFVSELAAKLHQNNAVLSIDVSPDLGTDWTEAFDYAALGKSADYMVLMGYDEHWDGAPTAGSVSSLPWLQRALDKLLKSVPSHKVITAFPFYSRDWTVSGKSVTSRELTLIEQGELLRTRKTKWDDRTSQYVADFIERGARHQVWAEDSRSLAAKYAMASSRNVAGFAYWYVGAETNDVWKALDNQWKYSNLQF
ncbi:S-layer homology domain-containing protein [Paenibacillus alvei]|uniref:S-layer homology domain-containing protein n=1 Tax=Paenibacillus alvei TaxID=44250 RepID=UPI0002DAB04D|nr:S-layer homology domain-containing protein [Paenibacillus alvei]MCY9703763.1 S-layer homology domain-containing protein [Paenibacillus alvei]MCY9768361.1 S-layer homology domain-containing protein [Paenibacillus alvei]